MGLFIFIAAHWYLSLFFQSFFHHRYAAHGLLTMSRGWEKFFYFCCFLTQGSSYISAGAYGAMHRLHHAHTDEAEDPHLPHYSPNAMTLLWKTRNSYHSIFKGLTPVEQKFLKDLPTWDAFDRIAHNWVTRIVWGAIYVGIYMILATEWWMWLFLPLTFAMGAMQGIAVNWWAHKYGYENFQLTNTSKNILPLDVLFIGEAYHNNHHRFPGRANNAIKWFEFDLTYLVMKAMNRAGIIRLKN